MTQYFIVFSSNDLFNENKTSVWNFRNIFKFKKSWHFKKGDEIMNKLKLIAYRNLYETKSTKLYLPMGMLPRSGNAFHTPD